jgi:hypothetical protein
VIGLTAAGKSDGHEPETEPEGQRQFHRLKR